MIAERNVQSGYSLLNLLNSCTDNKEKIPNSLRAKIINNENYKEYKYLGLPNEESLKKMDSQELFSLYNALDLIKKADTSLTNCIRRANVNSLAQLVKPNFAYYNSVKTFINQLESLKSTGGNYRNIESSFDFFNRETIKSLKSFDPVDPKKLMGTIHACLTLIFNDKDALYCIDKDEYENYVKKCIQIFEIKEEKKEAEARLDEIEKTQRKEERNKKLANSMSKLQMILSIVILVVQYIIIVNFADRVYSMGPDKVNRYNFYYGMLGITSFISGVFSPWALTQDLMDSKLLKSAERINIAHIILLAGMQIYFILYTANSLSYLVLYVFLLFIILPLIYLLGLLLQFVLMSILVFLFRMFGIKIVNKKVKKSISGGGNLE